MAQLTLLIDIEQQTPWGFFTLIAVKLGLLQPVLRIDLLDFKAKLLFSLNRLHLAGFTPSFSPVGFLNTSDGSI